MQPYLNVLQYYPFLLKGLMFTIEISLIGMVFGTVIGIVSALALLSPFRAVRWLGILYLDVFRSTPVLVQFIWVYYALPVVSGLSLTPIVAASIVLSLYSGSFHTETFRAGILSIGRGQHEAAQALGMRSYKVMFRIILPQATVRMLPTYAGTLITLIKDSALASTISVPELLHQGSTVASYTMSPLAALMVVGVMYFGLTYPVSRGVDALHARLRV
ncbi:MAG TPA: amino acid ABC transporter permease [Gammaproteobacteria bacterium]|nr:amino acid ABC transporter permease [Gammaproteobacteria bacterium]